MVDNNSNSNGIYYPHIAKANKSEQRQENSNVEMKLNSETERNRKMYNWTKQLIRQWRLWMKQ